MSMHWVRDTTGASLRFMPCGPSLFRMYVEGSADAVRNATAAIDGVVRRHGHAEEQERR